MQTAARSAALVTPASRVRDMRNFIQGNEGK
jgi:hypothetical protein